MNRSTPSGDASYDAGPDLPARVRPVRTCIGCRARADKADLVRVVAVQGGATTVVTPDLRGSAPGRGAHLHPDAACLARATQRKAFARALRVEGPVDTEPVVTYVRDTTSKTQTAPPPGGA